MHVTLANRSQRAAPVIRTRTMVVLPPVTHGRHSACAQSRKATMSYGSPCATRVIEPDALSALPVGRDFSALHVIALGTLAAQGTATHTKRRNTPRSAAHARIRPWTGLHRRTGPPKVGRAPHSGTGPALKLQQSGSPKCANAGSPACFPLRQSSALTRAPSL